MATIRTFSPEETLLMLCMHGAKHRWDRPAWIRDIAALTRTHQRMDWAQLMPYPRKGQPAMLFLGLLLATCIDELHLNYPFAGARVLCNVLKLEGIAGGAASIWRL